jgi:hypothetical protein
MDLHPGPAQRGADVGADRARSENCDSHGYPSSIEDDVYALCRVQYAICEWLTSLDRRGHDPLPHRNPAPGR